MSIFLVDDEGLATLLLLGYALLLLASEARGDDVIGEVGGDISSRGGPLVVAVVVVAVAVGGAPERAVGGVWGGPRDAEEAAAVN